MALRLLEKLRDHAQQRGRAPAVRESHGAGLTWTQLLGRVDALAARLRNTLAPASVVMLSCPNTSEYFVAFLGVLAAGQSVFPVSPELTDHELRDAAQRSAAAAIIGPKPARAALPALRLHIGLEELQKEDACGFAPSPSSPPHGLLLQSSGTTAQPKIVFRSAASLDAVAGQMCRAIAFSPDDHVLAAVPLCHSYGLEHGLLAPVWAGAGVHLCRGFQLPLLRGALAESPITILPGVPFIFEMLGQLGETVEGLQRLRRVYSAGARLPACVFETFHQRFGLRIGGVYGTTEIGSVTWNDPHAGDFDPLAAGRPMDGVSILILDPQSPRADQPLPQGREGHVAVRANSMFDGYIGQAAELPGGYFLTGDLGLLTPGGALITTGRLKLLIDVGGLKVNPLEVEEVLSLHPEVGACVVVGIPVSATAWRLKAVVTPRRDRAALRPRELREFARARLAAYKVPRIFEIRDSVPRSPTGKILRHLMETT